MYKTCLHERLRAEALLVLQVTLYCDKDNYSSHSAGTQCFQSRGRPLPQNRNSCHPSPCATSLHRWNSERHPSPKCRHRQQQENSSIQPAATAFTSADGAQSSPAAAIFNPRTNCSRPPLAEWQPFSAATSSPRRRRHFRWRAGSRSSERGRGSSGGERVPLGNGLSGCWGSEAGHPLNCELNKRRGTI